MTGLEIRIKKFRRNLQSRRYAYRQRHAAAGVWTRIKFHLALAQSILFLPAAKQDGLPAKGPVVPLCSLHNTTGGHVDFILVDISTAQGKELHSLLLDSGARPVGSPDVPALLASTSGWIVLIR